MTINPGNLPDTQSLVSYMPESEWRYRLISEVIADYIFVLDVSPDGTLLLSWASENLLLQTGRTPGEVMTPDMWETIIHPDDLPNIMAMMQQMVTTTEKGEFECRSFHKLGTERWVRISARQKRGADGVLTHIVGAVREITKQKQAEQQLKTVIREKETFLREVHHRVKNNLQTVMTLIQMCRPEIHDPVSLGVLDELREQVRTISVIYQELFQVERLSQVSMQPYLDLLSSYLLKTFVNGHGVELEMKCNGTVLDAKYAMPCGLIVNELVTNALKYAFPDGFQGAPVITVKLWRQDALHYLQVSDNGIGFPDSIDLDNPSSIGLQLVDIWAKHQMSGTLEMSQENGTTYTITFETQ